MTFNVAVVIGPILGGFLADPVHSFPSLFGDDSVLGGKSGVGWMRNFPYALPNVVSGFFISLAACSIVFGLDETHKSFHNKPDFGRRIGRWLVGMVTGQRTQYRYTALRDRSVDINATIDLEDPAPSSQPHLATTAESQPLTVNNVPPVPILKSEPTTSSTSTSKKPTIFTRSTLLTLLSHFLLALHLSAFNALIFLFLPNPRSTQPAHLPFRFAGGLGLSSEKVGLATAIIGLIGFPLQILAYPRLNAYWGTVRSYRFFLPFSGLAYSTLPYLVLIPASTWWWRYGVLWPCLTIVLACQVLSRTFTVPGTVILVNNSVTSHEILGTVHGWRRV